MRHPELNASPDLVSSFLERTDESGPEVALRLLREYPERSVTYLALGPLTNLANMLVRDSATVQSRIGRVVSMGGALDVPGNTTPVAECKFHLTIS